MRVYAATKNAGKVRELRDLFVPYGVAIDVWERYDDPKETADTYAGNAAIKARALHRQMAGAGMRACVLADDSGLEVAALGGRPGVYSARYAGENATWPQRRAEILREVAASGSQDRRARFVCTICFIDENGEELFVEGIADGELSQNERGEWGFGYDPIFYEPSEHATFAEISEAQKNAISHRARAVHALMQQLRETKRV